MAGYSQYTATTFMANIRRKNYKLPGSRGPAKKMYLPIYINKCRIVGLVDCGTDVTILQESLYYKIMPRGKDKLQPSDIENIYSFSNHVVPVSGRINFCVCLSNNHPGFDLHVYVIPSNANIPELLLGKDFLEAGLADLEFKGDPQNAEPTLSFKYPTTFHSTVHNCPADEIYTCTGEYELGPHQMESIEMYLSPAAPVVYTDWVLITAYIFDKVFIISSRTDIAYDPVRNCFVGTVCIVNTTDKPQWGIVYGKMKPINDYDPLLINDDIMPKLRTQLSNHPLGREILQSNMDYVKKVPTKTINTVSMSKKPHVQISDIDYAGAIFASEPEYSGTPSAVIPEINSTVQFLQGKSMYPGLDLRQAHMIMRTAETSQHLAAFTIPSDIYQFKSLPTGAARSPALFAELSHRMLDFEPFLNKNENPVLGSPKVEHTILYLDDIVTI
jgi:hypothetical protein